MSGDDENELNVALHRLLRGRALGLDVEELERELRAALARAADANRSGAVKRRYEDEIRATLVSDELARAVRALRVDDEETWRGVGAEVISLLGLEVGHGDLQSLGQTACCVAAEMLGEDPYAEPWN